MALLGLKLKLASIFILLLHGLNSTPVKNLKQVLNLSVKNARDHNSVAEIVDAHGHDITPIEQNFLEKIRIFKKRGNNSNYKIYREMKDSINQPFLKKKSGFTYDHQFLEKRNTDDYFYIPQEQFEQIYMIKPSKPFDAETGRINGGLFMFNKNKNF